MQLARGIYRETTTFPREELYGLTSQLRRSAVSVPSNIAEGQARFSKPEFRHFLRQARGSLAELETQIELAQHLDLLTSRSAQNLLEKACELGRILNGLIKSLDEKS